MRLLITFLVLFIAFQMPTTGQTVTKLKSSLLNLQGIEKVEALKNIISQTGGKKPLEAIRYSEILLEETVKQGLLIEELAALTNISDLYLRIGDYSKSTTYAIMLLRKYEKSSSNKEICSTLNKIGNLKSFQGDYSEAFKFLNRAKAISIKYSFKHLLADILRNIGVVFYFQGDYKNANNYCSKSLEIMEELENEEGISDAYFYLGVIAGKQGEYTESLKFLNRSFEFTMKDGDMKNIGLSHLAFARLYLQMQDFTQASREVQLAQAIADSLGLDYLQDRLKGLMPIVYMAEGKPQLAVEAHEKFIKSSDAKLQKKLLDQAGLLKMVQKEEMDQREIEMREQANQLMLDQKREVSLYKVFISCLSIFSLIMIIACIVLMNRKPRLEATA